MASFLDDIYKLTGRKTATFQETHEKEILERLCDPFASLKVWEDAAVSFLRAERIDVEPTDNVLRRLLNLEDHVNIYDFERNLDDTCETLAELLSGYVKQLSDLDISALSLNPSSYGYLISGLTKLADVVGCITELQINLACLTVTKIHHSARTLRNMSEYVEKDIRQATAVQVSDLIRTTNEIDQSLVLIRDKRREYYNDKFVGIMTLLHDSIYETAHRCAILPSRLHMHEVETMPNTLVNGGGFADIYKGTLSDGQVIALKVPRCFGKPDEIKRVHAEISKEGFVWHFSTHENVLPLLGISCIKFQNGKPDLLVLVTPWMSNGTLREFLRSKPKTDRGQMIRSVASGVNYLHKLRVPPVVHGDLRCDNILVNENGAPKIADFGLSRVKDLQASLTGTSTAGAKGSLRWQAPELLSPDMFGGTGKHTFASDIYALGMTCLEIVTDEVPYFGFSDAQVITAVVHGNIPKVSVNVIYQRHYERQWEMVKGCWSRKVEERPSAEDLLCTPN